MSIRFLSLFSLLFFLFSPFLNASNIDSTSVLSAKTGTFQPLFEKIEEESNSYQDYKLFKKSDVRLLKSAYKTDKAEFEKSISDLQNQLNEVKNLNNELSESNVKLQENVKALTDELDKSLTQIFIIVIVVLILALAYFIYRYKVLSDGEKQHKTDIEEVEKEFEEYKRSSIEREQKLRREIINLNASSKYNASKNTKEAKETKIDLDEMLAKKAEEENKKSK